MLGQGLEVRQVGWRFLSRVLLEPAVREVISIPVLRPAVLVAKVADSIRGSVRFGMFLQTGQHLAGA